MSDSFKTFGETAKGLSKNPLGIIALFIVLVYGFASLVTAFSGSLNANERLPLIWFLVVFPILVLAVFAWLVSQHAGKLYSPSDYRNEENYVAVVASLTAAKVRLDTDSPPTEVDFRRIAEVVRDAVPQRLAAESESWRNRLLWVDDRPKNNDMNVMRSKPLDSPLRSPSRRRRLLKFLSETSSPRSFRTWVDAKAHGRDMSFWTSSETKVTKLPFLFMQIRTYLNIKTKLSSMVRKGAPITQRNSFRWSQQ